MAPIAPLRSITATKMPLLHLRTTPLFLYQDRLIPPTFERSTVCAAITGLRNDLGRAVNATDGMTLLQLQRPMG